MRKRLIASLAFAVVGLLAAVPVSTSFDVTLPVALIACGIAGTMIGYAISIVVDVMIGNTGQAE